MGIVLDPAKSLVSIEVFYIEEVKKHGNSVFHFIRSKDEMEGWRAKGYRTEQEIAGLSAQNQPSEKQVPGGSGGSSVPGLPVKSFDPNKIISRVETFWRRITWADQNTLLSTSMKNIIGSDGQTATEIDGVKFRDMKLKMCLKRWDVKDDQGQPVPINNATIDMLVPEVAQELLSSFERVTEATSKALKN